MIQATPEQIHQVTKEILDRQEFLDRPTWDQILFQKGFEWLGDLARWSERNPDLARTLTIILGVALVLLIVHIIYTVAREFVSLRNSSNAGVSRRSLSALEGVAENWSEAFRLAHKALDADDMYRGLWITHRILLSVLDRMDHIKFVRWKTNTDYLKECRDKSTGAAILSRVTAAYEAVVYAHHGLESQEARGLLAQVEALAGEVRQ